MHAEHTKMCNGYETRVEDASRMMSAILGENWSGGSGFMLQFVWGAVCIVCMLSLFSNTHGLTWIATDHSPIGPRYRRASWGIAQSQVIHHQTGPKYDPAVRRQLCRDNLCGKIIEMQQKKEYNKKWVALFFTCKIGLDSWIIPKKKCQAQWTIHDETCLPHDFFKDLWLSITHLGVVPKWHLHWEPWSIDRELSDNYWMVGELSTIHQQFTKTNIEQNIDATSNYQWHSTKLDLTSRCLTNISCSCYKFTNPEMWNVSQSSFKHD